MTPLVVTDTLAQGHGVMMSAGTCCLRSQTLSPVVPWGLCPGCHGNTDLNCYGGFRCFDKLTSLVIPDQTPEVAAKLVPLQKGIPIAPTVPCSPAANMLRLVNCCHIVLWTMLPFILCKRACRGWKVRSNDNVSIHTTSLLEWFPRSLILTLMLPLSRISIIK